MSKWKEIRNTFVDKEENVVCIDAWKTMSKTEEGKVIAKIHIDTKEVTYLDEIAKTDSYARNMIEEAVKRMEEYSFKEMIV